MPNPNIGFSPYVNFVLQELKTANNIKNRSNRQSVERTLKMILEWFKIKRECPRLGLGIFAGIDSYDDSFLIDLECTLPSNKFIYSCSSKFTIDRKIFESHHLSGRVQGSALSLCAIVVHVDGDESLVYGYYGGQQFVVIKKIIGQLIKRQKKGGQSAVRFSRLAEESRSNYCARLIDVIQPLIASSNGVAVYMFGSRELRDQLHQKLKLTSETTIVICDDVQKEWKQSILEKINKQSKILKVQDFKKIESIAFKLETQPDVLCFGEDDIEGSIKDIECVVALPEFAKPNDLILYFNPKEQTQLSKLFLVLKEVHRVGKKFY